MILTKLEKPIDINEVESVYSGKANTCYCGCAGTHTYNPAHVEIASKNRGYAVTPEEVNIKTVRRIVNKLNRNLSELDIVDNYVFSLHVGNHDYTVYLVDRTKQKQEEDLKSANRALATKALVDRFNTNTPSGIVYLKVNENNESFQIHFRLNDPFVDAKNYDNGTAIIYPSDALYEDIQKLAGEVKIQWNNTRSIGWLSY